MNAQLTQETLRASFHAMTEIMWTNLREGYTATAEDRIQHLEALASMIEDEWYMGRIPAYKETLEEDIA